MWWVLVNGVGLGWRHETAALCESLARAGALTFVEVVAERLMHPTLRLPMALETLLELGVTVVPHGVSLGLGDAACPDRTRLARLAELCRLVRAPFMSEHIAFVRGAGRELHHLLPVPRTRDALAVLIDNIKRAQDALPVPLVLENIAALFEWPGASMREDELIARVVEATGVGLLVDVANLHANRLNGLHTLDEVPAAHVAYLHIAGGRMQEGFYSDTHAHPVDAALLTTLDEVLGRLGAKPLLLERDAGFTTEAALRAELETLRHLHGRAARCVAWTPRPGATTSNEPVAHARVALGALQDQFLCALDDGALSDQADALARVRHVLDHKRRTPATGRSAAQ